VIAVDASAVLAIALIEEDAQTFKTALAAAGGGLMTPINYWEVLVRLQAIYGAQGPAMADELIAEAGIEVVMADAAMARSAANAFQRFRGRPGGRLNLGDCFAYALAQREGDGLLFKGDDFPRTDVRSALG
jgi:ribonuclease VapC